ncbi:MAG: hypothetical protein U9N46_02515, partial [Euryarchaeota archaeon]|nr:hypothetical protein [Euryarchaeota archaeon]
GVLSQRDGAMQELYVINTGGERARITLMVNGVNLIVDPQEFDLAAKESRAVNVSVDHTEAGEYAGSILITARPAGNGSGGLGFGAGVRIPVSFVLKGGGGYPKFMIAEGLLIGSMAAMLLWMRRVEG